MQRARLGIGAALLLLLAAGACGRPAPAPEATDRPRLRVLGTAQDGGLPHAACDCERCEAARSDPSRARRIASLALLLPASDETYLVDATPDIREQLDALRDAGTGGLGRVDRAPVDGVLLTHAHFGHYTGLGFFGFEAIHTRALPVWCSPSMADYLDRNGPWSQLVAMGNVTLNRFEPDRSFALGAVRVEPIRVPHRDEYTDTFGFVFRGPAASVLYVPDTDTWRGWESRLLALLSDVDVALLDGTFYSADELPGRAAASIGHPPIVDTLELLAPHVRSGRPRIYFVHLNHSNPALDPNGPVRARLRAQGFDLADEGQEFPL